MTLMNFLFDLIRVLQKTFFEVFFFKGLKDKIKIKFYKLKRKIKKLKNDQFCKKENQNFNFRRET